MQVNWLAGLQIQSSQVPGGLLWLSNLLFLACLLWAVSRGGWRDLAGNGAQQHVYFGAMVLLLLMWGFKAGVTPGLGFHPLGATLFTLMFNQARSLSGLSVVLIVSGLLTQFDWPGLGINGLLSVVLPVMMSMIVLRLSWRYLPDNFFVYVFVCAFFGAGIAVASSRLALSSILLLSGAYAWDTLWQESIMILPLFMFPEAFITGLLITLFVVYRPAWVETFDDERYLHGK